MEIDLKHVVLVLEDGKLAICQKCATSDSNEGAVGKLAIACTEDLLPRIVLPIYIPEDRDDSGLGNNADAKKLRGLEKQMQDLIEKVLTPAQRKAFDAIKLGPNARVVGGFSLVEDLNKKDDEK